jgi:hypothetical protein
MGRASSRRTSTSLPSCASCKCDVGEEAGRIPFHVDDSASTPGDRAKHECFCPTCFVYVRSPREPERWRPGFFVPIRCTNCKLESVSIGQDACMQCGSRIVVVLPPKPGVV